MAKQLQIRGGTTIQHSTFTGALREITIDTDKDVVVVHDGTTVGGFPLAKQTSVDSKVTKVTSTDNAIVRFDGTTGAVQNSGVIINDNGNVGIGTSSPGARLQVVGSYTVGGYTNVAGVFGAAVESELYIGSRNGNNPFIGSGGAYSLSLCTNGSDRLILDSVGNVLLTSSTGGLGYGTGAGGIVTQVTSKGTAVTLNKPSGYILTNNASLAAGASVEFQFNNSLLSATDTIYLCPKAYGYFARIEIAETGVGRATIRITGLTTRSDAIQIAFIIIKGAEA